MRVTEDAIEGARENPKGYWIRECGVFHNGQKAPGEAYKLREIEYGAHGLKSIFEDCEDLQITICGPSALIEYKHARLNGFLVNGKWAFLDFDYVLGKCSYVIPNNTRHYVLNSICKLLEQVPLTAKVKYSAGSPAL